MTSPNSKQKKVDIQAHVQQILMENIIWGAKKKDVYMTKICMAIQRLFDRKLKKVKNEAFDAGFFYGEGEVNNMALAEILKGIVYFSRTYELKTQRGAGRPDEVAEMIASSMERIHLLFKRKKP